MRYRVTIFSTLMKNWNWQKVKQWGLFLGVVVAFGGISFLSLVEPNLELAQPFPEDHPDFTMEELTVYHIDGSDVTWEMDAQSAKMYQSEHVAQLSQIEGRFMEDEMPVVQLFSPSGQLFLDKSDLSLNDAVLRFTAGEAPVTLNATLLVWQSELSRFEGSGEVLIDSGALKLRGDRFFVDVASRKLTLSENTKAVIDPDGLAPVDAVQ